MGEKVSKPIQDSVSSVSPWNTQIVIDNQVTTPVRVFLARNADEPSVEDSIEHKVPPERIYAINSGWIREPRATLIVRVAVHEAKVYRMSHAAHLKFELVPCGLKVSSFDNIEVEDYPDPGSVPNNDTVPMVLRAESFRDRRPESEEPRTSVAREAVAASSPSASPPSAPQATVHGRASEVATQGIDVNVADPPLFGGGVAADNAGNGRDLAGRDTAHTAGAAAAEAHDTATAEQAVAASPSAAEAASAPAAGGPLCQPRGAGSGGGGGGASALIEAAAAAVADTEAQTSVVASAEVAAADGATRAEAAEAPEAAAPAVAPPGASDDSGLGHVSINPFEDGALAGSSVSSPAAAKEALAS